MNRLDKAKLLDGILLKFTGNKSYTQADLHLKSFYETLDKDFFVVENHFQHLIGDGMIEPRYSTDKNGEMEVSYVLSAKGFATMTDLENMGYETRHKEENENKKIITGTFRYSRLTFYLGIISVVLTIIGLIKCSVH